MSRAVASSLLYVPNASQGFFGLTEWIPTPSKTTPQKYTIIDDTLAGFEQSENLSALDPNYYQYIQFAYDLPNDIHTGKTIYINLKASGINLGSAPIIRFWIYTDYPNVRQRQIATATKIDTTAAGPTSMGMSKDFSLPLPTTDELKQIGILVQSTTGTGGAPGNPWEPGG